MTVLHDLDGKQYRVESQLAEGGEGIIYTLVGESKLVAKLYKPNQRNPERRAKLQAMLVAPPADEMLKNFQHPSISWPVSIVLENNAFAGFMMRRIKAGFALINAYNPRASHFLGFNWRDQHQVAMNLCAALNALHSKGYVMGDVNERNIMVTQHGLVTLVDTDSFQVRHGGRTFRCPVGVPEYTPVELHGQAFDQVDRLPQHDNFGLAILIFRLLMHGQHPFTGAQKDLSLSVGKVDEHCIRSGIFPWLENSQFTRPPSAKDLDVLHSGLQILFGQAFVTGHKNPQLRPTALEWLRALNTAQSKLIKCSTGAHWLQSGRICVDCGVVVLTPSLPPSPAPPSIPISPPSSPQPISLSPPPPSPPPLYQQSLVALLVSKPWVWATALGLLGLMYMILVPGIQEQHKLTNQWMALERAQREFANKQESLKQSEQKLANEKEYLKQARLEFVNEQKSLKQAQREFANKQEFLNQAKQKLANEQESLNQAQREFANEQESLNQAQRKFANEQVLSGLPTISKSFEPETVVISARELISGRYRDNGDGTVTDVTTKLMWKRCSEGQTWTGSTCDGRAIKITWNDAMPNERQKSWAAFAGCSDWRMPTIEELRQLVYCSNGTPVKEAWDNSCSGKINRNGDNYQRPTIDQIAFPNTPEEWFLSASLIAYDTRNAWIVNFNNGYDNDYYRADAYRARLVCAGQSGRVQ